MRLALITDIHGNCHALEQALPLIRSEGVDEIVCLGDVSAFGPQPTEVIALLRELRCPIVMGNTDDMLIDPEMWAGVKPLLPEWMAGVEDWCMAQLSEADKEFIRSFVPTYSVGRLLCYHGSPKSYHDAIWSTTPDEQLNEWLDGYEAALFAGGHTHYTTLRRVGEKFVMNPGSLGAPEGNGPHHLGKFAIVDNADGDFQISFRSFSQDPAGLKKVTLDSGMPFADQYLARFGLA